MLKFYLFLSLFLGLNMELENSKLKETTITNHLILELVRDYINEYEFFNDSQIKPSILLKLEHSKDGQIVFLGATFLISYFESNLPDSYAKVGDIVIFIYNDGIYAIAEIPPEPPVLTFRLFRKKYFIKFE
jgi:hypothetical protein